MTRKEKHAVETAEAIVRKVRTNRAFFRVLDARRYPAYAEKLIQQAFGVGGSVARAAARML